MKWREEKGSEISQIILLFHTFYSLVIYLTTLSVTQIICATCRKTLNLFTKTKLLTLLSGGGGGHKFSKNLGNTSNVWAPEVWHDASSVRKTEECFAPPCKIESLCRPDATDLWTSAVREIVSVYCDIHMKNLKKMRIKRRAVFMLKHVMYFVTLFFFK
jgi:hypothetical protein